MSAVGTSRTYRHSRLSSRYRMINGPSAQPSVRGFILAVLHWSVWPNEKHTATLADQHRRQKAHRALWSNPLRWALTFFLKSWGGAFARNLRRRKDPSRAASHGRPRATVLLRARCVGQISGGVRRGSQSVAHRGARWRGYAERPTIDLTHEAEYARPLLLTYPSAASSRATFLSDLRCPLGDLRCSRFAWATRSGSRSR